MNNDEREWLETDGLGGFASGTVSGRRTRRYHALLLTARTPPTDRYVLVNGYEATVTTDAGPAAISSQRYVPGVIHPHGDKYLSSFADDLWPTWTYNLPNGAQVQAELFVPHGYSAVVLRWSLLEPVIGSAILNVRFLLSGRDHHSLHRENEKFHFTSTRWNDAIVWEPYGDVPGVRLFTNGSYSSDPLWYRQFLYTREQARGLDCIEDLASPGPLRFDLKKGPAFCLLTAMGPHGLIPKLGAHLGEFIEELDQKERTRRNGFASRPERSADQFIVKRGKGTTIIAGYPWFTDWGRDTFISLRGICLTTGRLELAGEILRAWAGTVSEGMLPNRFPDHGSVPEYNSVDASLWYVIAVWEYLQALEAEGKTCADEDRAALLNAVQAILIGYSHGTRFKIRADHDGLLEAGETGVQLTWMDAKVGDWIVTPRIGKPVEVQALWINALWVGTQFSSDWKALFQKALDAFPVRFWNSQTGCLFDVIDVDHRPGAIDPAIRPNQILAVGGLPLCLLSPEEARQVVDVVETRLLTPLGPRTLAPDHPAYQPHYIGSLRERDAAYHQGTVWPWLMGPFIEAWVRVHGKNAEAREEARRRFLEPLLAALPSYGTGHLCEIADGEPTKTEAGPRHLPRGCPFQAWSIGELLRLSKLLQ